MKKYLPILIIAIALMFCLAQPGPLQAAPDVAVKVDGRIVSFPDQKPYIDSASRTMVPVRAPMEAMGCKVDWNDEARQATITKDGIAAIFTVDSNAYTINGQSRAMDTKAVIANNRTAFPIRFAAEAMGATVEWEQDTYTVLITTAGNEVETVDLGKSEEKDIQVGDYNISVYPVGRDFWFGISDTSSPIKNIRVVCTSHPEWNENNRLMWDGSRMVMPQDRWKNDFKFFKDGYSPVEPKSGDQVTFDVYGKVNGQETKLVIIIKTLS